MIDATEGGVEFGGEVPEVFSPPSPADGGVEFGGACGDVFEPPTPPPGSACSTATAVYPGVEYSYTSPGSGGGLQWWHFAVANGDWHFETTGFSSAPGSLGAAYDGVNCSGLVIRSFLSHDCEGVTIIFGGGIWFVVQSGVFQPPEPYTFKLLPGLCPP
jgi:hypothetical protein